MKKILFVSFVSVFLFVFSPLHVFAAKPDHAGGGSKPGDDAGSSTSAIGYDISYPQCGKRIKNGAFGIVGVNGGVATKPNPCFAEQLKWAYASTDTVASQDRAQLYINTANPGEVLEQYTVDTWPTDNSDLRRKTTLNNTDGYPNNPYGACTTNPNTYRGYVNDRACSWQYGWERAQYTVDTYFKPGAAAAAKSQNVSSYVWWLDVETMNSWQGEAANPGDDGYEEKLARNTATLEGMTALLTYDGAKKIGIYSTHYQWGRIVGNSYAGATGNLVGLDSWLAGARNETNAKEQCVTKQGLTGGAVSLVQFVSKNLDHNVSCTP